MNTICGLLCVMSRTMLFSIRRACLFTLLTLPCFHQSFAAPSLLDRFYVGVMGGVRLDNSQNVAFYSPSKSTFGPGHSASTVFGSYITDRLFLETGIGRYSTTQTFNFSGPTILTEYAPLPLRMDWWHIPIRAGYVLHQGPAWQVSSLLGCHMIFDGRVRGAQGLYPEQVALEPSRGIAGTAPTPGTASIFINDGKDFVALLYGGLRVSRHLGYGIRLHADAGFSMGLRHVTSATAFFSQSLVAGSSEAEERTSVFKGDAVGLSIGMQYCFDGR